MLRTVSAIAIAVLVGFVVMQIVLFLFKLVWFLTFFLVKVVIFGIIAVPIYFYIKRRFSSTKD